MISVLVGGRSLALDLRWSSGSGEGALYPARWAVRMLQDREPLPGKVESYR